MSVEHPNVLPSPSRLLNESVPTTPSDTMDDFSIASESSPVLSTTSTFSSAAEIYSSTSASFPSSVGTSPSGEFALSHSSSPRENISFEVPFSSFQSPETDPQILDAITEALKGKDRIYVLKLGELMESLINERRDRIDVNPTTSYQRMLVHKCSGYYNLAPESDPVTKVIVVYCKSESRIPARRVSELVPSEETVQQPAFKIMRRVPQDHRARSRYNSQPGSVAGEDADLSDVEQSETSSISGRSNATGTSKRHLTIEEREAAYKEARSRIFMDFNEKEAEKEKDSSANSSTHSLVSGSGSTSGGRSSTGDADDSASSAATESEWSGPVARDKRDGWRGGSTTSSSRSTRLSDTSYTKNGSGSSRNSRAASPSFTYPSLYEPSSSSPSYDPPYGAQAPPHGYIQYYYSYPGMPGQPPYMAPYPYYPSYGYSSPPPQASPHHSDPTNPVAPDSAYPQAQSPPIAGYPNAYMWPHPSAGHQPPHIPVQQQATHPAPPTSIQQPSSQGQPQPQQMPYPYMQPGPYTYPMSYYAPPHFPPGHPVQPPHTPPHQHGQQYGQHDMVQQVDHPHYAFMNGVHTNDSNGTSRTSSRSSNNQVAANSSGARRGAPRARQTWGPAPASGGAGMQYAGQGNEAVGPRLSTRRASGTSSGSGSAGNRTPGDEASSTTSSSTTSSSSRRTFTSTSSKHPLPARPDWAVGLKAHAGLHPPRSHDHTNSRTMSPARLGGQAHLSNHHPPGQQLHQPSLQSTDFPPLSSGPAPEKRTPVVGSAWTNGLASRSIMSPGQSGLGASAPGTVLVHYPNAHNDSLAAEDGYERPPPKGDAELFNPKGGARKLTPNRASTDLVDKENARAGIELEGHRSFELTATAVLVNKTGGMSITDGPLATYVDGTPAISVPPTRGADGVESFVNGSS